MKKQKFILLVIVLQTVFQYIYSQAINTISLDGEWSVRLDKQQVGETEQWAKQPFTGAVTAHLPGSLTTNFIGDDISLETPWMGYTGRGTFESDPRYTPYRQPGNVKVPFWLQPQKYYRGKAFYQRVISIPSSWGQKKVELILERCHWSSTAWIDGRKVGGCESLSTPHRYDLGELTAGNHLLTLCIDNDYLIRVGPDAHSVTDHTQTNWNGVIGKIELVIHANVSITSQQIYPKNDGTLQLKLDLINSGNSASTIPVNIQIIDKANGKKVASLTQRLSVASGNSTEIIALKLANTPKLWSEFTPNLYIAVTSINTETRSNIFGFREISVDGRTILVNNIPTFMRGNLDCAAFPLTGYPSTDVTEWRRIFGVYKSYGLNHVRFHSWCPPEAAFIAADEVGMYLQPECGVWRGTCPFTEVKPVEPFLFEEAQRICGEFGNHPSFVMFAHGNEPWELDRKILTEKWVPEMKKFDTRHLVCAGAHYPVDDGNDYQLPATVEGFKLRYYYYFNSSPRNNYEDQINQKTSPCIAHEAGEWCVYPNLKEIDKYKGVMKARNFEIVRDFMTSNHIIDQAEDFLMASGKFQTLVYKEETESFLRTRGIAGFQMLGLNDFPGQGTALVGVVDVFWDSKPYVTPAEYKRFSGPAVPLALFDKRTWSSAETFTAQIRIAQYSGKKIENTTPKWQITNSGGEILATGSLNKTDIPVGNTAELGDISFSLKTIHTADKLTLTVSLPGTEYQNEWSFWVYPEAPVSEKGDAIICHTLEEALVELSNWKSVLLLPKFGLIAGKTAGTFQPIFWNKNWFPGQKEHTLGMLIDKAHPALSQFPTDFYADWQWADLMNHSKPMILDSLPAEIRPVVQPIDDWNTCRRLGLIVETKVGKGKLVIASIDLESDLGNRLVAKQLNNSLIAYINSPTFNPKNTLSASQLSTLFTHNGASKIIAKISSSTSHSANPATNLIDANTETIWSSAKNTDTNYPHSVQIEFSKISKINGLNLLPSINKADGWVNAIEILCSSDGFTWTSIQKFNLTNNQEWKSLSFKQVNAKFLQIRLLSAHDKLQKSASFAEIEPIIQP